MKKILFVIAMEKEATDIAKKLKLEEVKNSLKIYRKNNISLLITGIGKQQTAINLTQYLENNKENFPDEIINVGYVGSTNTKIGTWVNVNKIYNYEWNIPGEQRYSIEGFKDFEDSKTDGNLQESKSIIKVLENCKNDSKVKILPCYSAECFVTSTDLKKDCVFDMELHSIYLVCQMYNIKELISLKKVSDNLSLKDYYSNINMKEVMELESCLDILKILDFLKVI